MSYYKGGRSSGSSSYRGGSSYRGSRDSPWRGSRGSGYSGSRNSSSGRYFDSNPSYDRSKSSYSGSDDRYAGRSSSRGDDYRYSQSSSDYASRDFARSSSPEPSRKRVRSSPSYSAPRRSHERSFGTDYSPRGSGFYDKGSSSGGGGYLSEKGSYREVRESRTSGGSGSDFAFRKPSNRGYSPRGSFRGRSRGMRRGFRSGASSSAFLRKKSSDSYAIRKGRSSRTEYLRRLRQYRMRRSSGLKDGKNESDDEQDDDDDDDDDDDEHVEDDSEKQEEEEEDAKEEMDSENVKEEVNIDEAKQESKTKDEEDNKSEKDKDEELDKTPVKEKTASVVKKKINKIKKKGSLEKDDDDKGKDEPANPLKIKLKCPHCGFIGTSFWEYSKHLSSKKHSSSLQALSAKLRGKLTKMRIDQREKQKSLDEECKAKNMRLKTFFCSICKLNYRTLKSSHQGSLSHKKMKEFTLPYCRVCRLQFKSPFSYESHLGELMHLKRKARMERLSRDVTEDVNDLDTNSFMVLDAVGSGDESVSEKTEDEEKTNENEADKDGELAKKKKKDEIKLGSDHCKLVEVYYCDLCKIYLPRQEDQEKSLTIHCRSRTHLQRYIKHRDAKALRKRAVKLHKEHEKEKEILKSQTKDQNEEEKEKEKEVKNDKSWSEVDKDLSDLLQDDENKDKDDEDDFHERERYDRFKQSHKNDKQGGENITVSNGSINDTKNENKEGED